MNPMIDEFIHSKKLRWLVFPVQGKNSETLPARN